MQIKNIVLKLSIGLNMALALVIISNVYSNTNKLEQRLAGVQLEYSDIRHCPDDFDSKYQHREYPSLFYVNDGLLCQDEEFNTDNVNYIRVNTVIAGKGMDFVIELDEDYNQIGFTVE